MSKTHLVIPDSHAHPEFNNNRADYLGKLILDVRPDVVIHLGDSADLSSLASYDKGTRAAIGRTYRADIDSHLDFIDRAFSPLRKAKRKMPHRVFLEGNHEHRIERALDASPELIGTIDMRDLQLEENFNEVVYYEGGTPGVYQVDGVFYAHYFISGLMGRPISGQHHAASLLTSQMASCTQGHSHLCDYAVRTRAGGTKMHGLVAGVFQDYDSKWAGKSNELWWRGVIVKHNVENGSYDPQFISLDSLRKEYG